MPGMNVNMTGTAQAIFLLQHRHTDRHTVLDATDNPTHALAARPRTL